MVSQGWKYFKENFYYFSHVPKTWYSAQQFCISRNSHLASVTSDSEQVSAVSTGSILGVVLGRMGKIMLPWQKSPNISDLTMKVYFSQYMSNKGLQEVFLIVVTQGDFVSCMFPQLLRQEKETWQIVYWLCLEWTHLYSHFHCKVNYIMLLASKRVGRDHLSGCPENRSIYKQHYWYHRTQEVFYLVRQEFKPLLFVRCGSNVGKIMILESESRVPTLPLTRPRWNTSNNSTCLKQTTILK